MARLDVAETFYNIKFPGHMHTQDSLNYAANFKFQDTDIVIVTYPKSGKECYVVHKDDLWILAYIIYVLTNILYLFAISLRLKFTCGS